MTDSHPGAEGVLESNRALRLWAVGLRSWSTSARATSASERHHAQHLKAQRRVPDACRRAPGQDDSTAVLELPSLGDVHVDELLAVLIIRHGFGATGAVHALQVAMLMAGYPPDTEEVLAADTWEIVDAALRYPR
jgi:hypothetical protein